MIKVDLEELIYLLLSFDEDNDFINNFVANASDVFDVLNELTQNIPVTIDCMQFDSEGMDDEYYCITVEKRNDDVLVSVVEAQNELNEKFYAINGNVFVANYIPEKFEKDINSYPYTNLGHVIRIKLNDTDCDNHENEIYTEKGDHMIHQSWSDGTSYFSRSFQSSDSELLDRIIKEWSDFESKFK